MPAKLATTRAPGTSSLRKRLAMLRRLRRALSRALALITPGRSSTLARSSSSLGVPWPR
jgi:hypothetical protein